MKAWLMARYIGYCIGGFVACVSGKQPDSGGLWVMVPGVLIVLYISYAGRNYQRRNVYQR